MPEVATEGKKRGKSTAPIPGLEEGGILDKSGDQPGPVTTNDSRSSSTGFEVASGYLYRPDHGEEPVLLNKVVLREMTGVEEDILTSEKIDVYKRFSYILANCLEEIYNDDGVKIDRKDEMSKVVDNLTSVDRMQMIVHLRTISVEEGKNYSFKANCGKCGAEFRKSVDLEDVRITPMKDPKLRFYDVDLPSGKKAKCKVVLGKHESDIGRASDAGSHQLSLQMKSQIEELDGRVVNLPDIQKLSLKDRNALRTAFKEYGGAIDFDVPHRCTSCGAKFDISIDIGQPGFFFPSEM